jgi:hypothetical protein
MLKEAHESKSLGPYASGTHKPKSLWHLCALEHYEGYKYLGQSIPASDAATFDDPMLALLSLKVPSLTSSGRALNPLRLKA